MTRTQITTATPLPRIAVAPRAGLLARIVAALAEVDRRYREARRMDRLTVAQRRDMGLPGADAAFYAARGRAPHETAPLPIRTTLW